jgi:hypothetical protein
MKPTRAWKGPFRPGAIHSRRSVRIYFARLAVVLLATVLLPPPAFAPPGRGRVEVRVERPGERTDRDQFDVRPEPPSLWNSRSSLEQLEAESLARDLARWNLLPSVPLAEGIEQYVRKQEEERDLHDLDKALDDGDVDRLTVLPSPTDPNDMIVRLKGAKSREVTAPSKPPQEWEHLLADQWIKVDPMSIGLVPHIGLKIAPDDTVGFAELDPLPIQVHIKPAELSFKQVLQDSISQRHHIRLRTLDRLILTKANGVRAPAAWAAPVRIVDYSDATQTLTVRPPEPLAKFEINVSDWNKVSQKDQASLREYLRNTPNVVRTGGELSAEVSLQLSLVQRTAAVHSPRSANVSVEQIRRAADLGNKVFNSKPAVILDGLPDPPRGPLGMWQLFSMKLSVWTGDAWRGLRRSLDFTTLGPQTRVLKADRATVLEQLRNGHDNVLILIAHNTDGMIYSSDGKGVSIREIEQLTRPEAPERAVILITCKAGEVAGEMPSLAEILLQNRLATAVFASRQVVDAADLPVVLKDLTSGKIGAALHAHGYQHIVSIKGPGRG